MVLDWESACEGCVSKVSRSWVGRMWSYDCSSALLMPELLVCWLAMP
jgi:hypothetical protein